MGSLPVPLVAQRAARVHFQDPTVLIAREGGRPSNQRNFDLSHAPFDYRKKGGNDRAIADYSEAIRLDPKYLKAYGNRGDAYVEKGDNDRAIADYNEAIRPNPKYDGAYHNRGEAYRAKGDYDSDCRGAAQVGSGCFRTERRDRIWAYTF